MGDANSKHWLEVLEHIEKRKLTALVPGHGAAARDPNRAISDTRHYLAYTSNHWFWCLNLSNFLIILVFLFFYC